MPSSPAAPSHDHRVAQPSRERVVNAANIAANTRIGDPNFVPDNTESTGPVPELLGGGKKILFMRDRTPLRVVADEAGKEIKLMAQLSLADRKTGQAGVVRIDDAYAIAQDVDGESVLTELDPHGNKATTADLDGTQVDIYYQPNNDALHVIPGATGSRQDIEITVATPPAPQA